MQNLFKCLLIAFFFATLSLTSFGQSGETIEKELVGHIKNIEKWSSYGNDHNEDLLNQENETFKTKLLKYTAQHPLTLKHKFKELSEHLYIATSDDGKFRVYSWDTQTGGTMHFYQTVYQYEGANGKVYSQSRDLEEGEPGSFVYDVFSLETKNGTVYLACSNTTLSTSDAYQSVRLFKIENNALNDAVKLIKTQTGVKNLLGFEYDFFSVADREERPVKLIHYDKAAKSLKIPVVLQDKTYPHGKVTDKFIVYKFNGTHFVKTK